MRSNPGHTKHARRRRRGRLSVCAVLLLSVCVLLILVKCAPKKEEKGRDGGAASSAAHSRDADTTAAPEKPKLPDGWVYSELGTYGIKHGTLVLVNADHAFDPSDVTTVSVWENKTGSYLVKDVYTSLDPLVMDRLNEWMDAFAVESGRTDVNVVAGYRSYDDQQALYDNAVQTKGQAHADRYLALPGHSEHHTGLALDLSIYDTEAGTSRDFTGTGEYAWAKEHAWEFGFIQRYPEEKSGLTGIDYESWHYRYVGRAHAFCMREHDLCLEEYIDFLRGYPFDGEHLLVDCGEERYEIWYCPGTTAVVPEEGLYTVSGNNADGLIVTVPLD